MTSKTTVSELIEECRGRLTKAELRVADVVLAQPKEVAFGTMAEVGRMSGTSGATVFRFASELGFDGYPGLQSAVQEELSAQLGPAAQRLRDLDGDDLPGQVLHSAMANVAQTLDSLDRAAFDSVVDLLSDTGRRLMLCPGYCARGVVQLAAENLSDLRADVTVLDGNPAQIGRGMAQAREGDVLVAVDFTRYDRWVLDVVRLARRRKMTVVAVTDVRGGELAGQADQTLTVSTAGPGPFDSQVGTLALLGAIVTGVARSGRPEATQRLAEVEQAWRALATFADRE